MKLRKFGHSCVRLEKQVGDSSRVLVLDPGVFSEPQQALEGADAVLITHEHPDHLAVDAVAQALDGVAELVVYATPVAAAALREAAPAAASRVHDAEDGLDEQVAGFRVRGFGSQHALIHPRVPMIANTGYLIDEALFHPGDSFTVPTGIEVRTLLVPVHAPWSKIAEVIDYVIAVRPEKAFNIHDALLNDTGLSMVEAHISRHGSAYGTEFEHLNPGDSREIQA